MQMVIHPLPQQLDIKLVDEKLRISASETSEAQLRIEGDEEAVSLVQVENRTGTLSIHRRMDLRRGFWRSLTTPAAEVTLLLPKDWVGAVNASSVSGRLSAEKLHCGTARFSTTSGRMELSQVSTEQLEAGSVSGGLSLRYCAASKKLSISNVSGSIEGEGLLAPEILSKNTSGATHLAGDTLRLSANSVSGGVSWKSATFPPQLNINNVSGQVKIQVPRDDQLILRFKSTSGHVNCSYPVRQAQNPEPDCPFWEIKTVSGGLGIEEYTAPEA